jgi:hypothetical protein
MNDAEREQLIERIATDSALWRAEAWAAYAQVSDELHRIRARQGSGEEAGKAKTETQLVQDDLDDALRAMAPPQPKQGGKSWRAWMNRMLSRASRALKLYYSGADIDRTWSAIHRASESLYAVYDDDELDAQAARLKALVIALPDLQPQLAALVDARNKLEEKGKGKKGEVRAKFRELYRQAIGATESLQAEARTLRNVLFVASCALFAVVFMLGFVNLFDDSVFPLCIEGDDAGKQICPGGESSHPFDVFAVELAGMLGGILSMVIPLAIGDRIKTPYRVFNHQLLLKVLAGAATGLAGVMLVESNFVSALVVTNSSMILGYAVFFGFSQQVLTGIIDRRASELGKETPTTKSV